MCEGAEVRDGLAKTVLDLEELLKRKELGQRLGFDHWIGDSRQKGN